MSSIRKVPTLNLEELNNIDQRKTFIQSLYQGLKEYGFVVLKNHGISQATIDQAYQLSKKLFELSLDKKQQYIANNGQRGYIPFGKEKAKGFDLPDLKEYWHIGPQLEEISPYFEAYPSNLWPEEIPEFKAFFLGLHNELNSIAEKVLYALGEAMNLEANFFQELIKDGNSIQRLIHYPALAKVKNENGVNEGAVRAAPHADINLMTLLIGATDSGLELLDKDGSWLPIESQEGEIVLDTGDMMAYLTNNQLPATVHRVVNPKDTSKPRYSIPFFVHPHNNASLDALPGFKTDEKTIFEPITAGEFLDQRLKENGF